jgi:hypothetical protein
MLKMQHPAVKKDECESQRVGYQPGRPRDEKGRRDQTMPIQRHLAERRRGQQGNSKVSGK